MSAPGSGAATGGSLAADIAPQVTAFAREVGSSGPVTVIGGRTHVAIGCGSALHADADSGFTAGTTSASGGMAEGVREVRAPAGVWEHEPSEMTVRCGAGTTVAELAAHLAPGGQMVPFDPPDSRATVGGVLACGHSGHRRLRYGHVRDLVLQVRYVDAEGKVVTAGGPTVKNVSGYDLPRLMVGSMGTLGLLAEVILRTLPVPPASQWMSGSGDPFAAFGLLYRPSSILWNGASTWILLEGDPSDVAAEADKLEPLGFGPCEGGPTIPTAGRESMQPSALRSLAGTPGDWVAEVGVGLVHRAEPVNPPPVAPANAALMDELKQRLDPTGRLNPGRKPW